VSIPADQTVVESVGVSCGKSPVAIVSRSAWPVAITAAVGKISTSSATGAPGVSGRCDARV